LCRAAANTFYRNGYFFWKLAVKSSKVFAFIEKQSKTKKPLKNKKAANNSGLNA